MRRALEVGKLPFSLIFRFYRFYRCKQAPDSLFWPIVERFLFASIATRIEGTFMLSLRVLEGAWCDAQGSRGGVSAILAQFPRLPLISVTNRLLLLHSARK